MPLLQRSFSCTTSGEYINMTEAEKITEMQEKGLAFALASFDRCS